MRTKCLGILELVGSSEQDEAEISLCSSDVWATITGPRQRKTAVLAQDKGSLMTQMTEQSSHHQVELKQVIQVKNTASQEEQEQEQAELKQDIRFLFFLLNGMLVWFWLVESYAD